MARVKHIEPLDRGDHGKWSDEAERLARVSRQKQCVAALRQGVGIVVSGAEELEQLTRGPYIEAIKGAREVAEALTRAVPTLSEFLLDVEERCIAVLQDANHPGRAEAEETWQSVADARAVMQNCAKGLQEMEGRLIAADRRSREPNRSS